MFPSNFQDMSLQMDELLSLIRSGDRRVLARTLSLLENDLLAASSLIKQAFFFAGQAMIIGVTGAPGAGKSTIVDGLTTIFRKEGKSVAIVAMDPSSPFTGGAILGDRIRMQAHAVDTGVFIRSMATRGHMGGLARATAGAVTLLDAAGFDVILVETVGVGQDEVDIIKIAAIRIVVLAPGMGDEIQAMKAGVMEIGDIFALNKSDREGAMEAEREVRSVLSMNHRQDNWEVPLIKTSATRGEGIDSLHDAVLSRWFFVQGQKEDRFTLASTKDFLTQLGRDMLFQDFIRATDFDSTLTEKAEKIMSKTLDPYSIIEDYISRYKK